MPLAVLVTGLLSACAPEHNGMPGNNSLSSDTVKVTGELRSANSRFYGAPRVHNIWQYTIAFMAQDGSQVQAGRPILAFDTQELKVQIREKNSTLNQKQKELQAQQILAREVLAEARLAVEEARALVDKAELKAQIPVSLLASREYRENQLLLRQAKLTLELRIAELEKETRVQDTETEILEREIRVLDTKVEQLRKSIDVMTIKAPRDGVVIHVIGRRGNKSAVGDDVWGGRRVIEFPDLSQLEVHLEIPERESARIAVGQAVNFTLDAAPDRPFEGQVTSLASVVHTRSNNQLAKVFDAVVSLQAPDPELMRPGMSVDAEIQVTGKGENRS
jgi:multidrug resistance efflux pump